MLAYFRMYGSKRLDLSKDISPLNWGVRGLVRLVVMNVHKFWTYAIVKIPKTTWYKLGLKYDPEYGEYVDNNGEVLYDIDDVDFWCEEMDDSRHYVYELERIDLERMEQIEVFPEKREGEAIAQSSLDISISPETTKLRVHKEYVSAIISRFGNEAFMSPDGDTFFIATIHEEATPELYMWTQKFSPPIKIICPKDTEAEMGEYF